MRHKKQGKKLNRNSGKRRALFKNLIEALIIHEQIKTTEAKAKAIKRLVAKLITKAKEGSLHARRQILAFLPNKIAANKLVDDIAIRFNKRAGGFTRFVRLGKRRGDDAMMVKIELVEKRKKEIKESKAVRDKKSDGRKATLRTQKKN